MFELSERRKADKGEGGEDEEKSQKWEFATRFPSGGGDG